MSKYILGVKVDTDLTMDKAVGKCVELINREGSHYVTTTNAEFIVDAQSDSDFKDIINRSDISTADGAGVLFASKYEDVMSGIKHDQFFNIKSLYLGLSLGFKSIINNNIGERVSGVDLVTKLCEYAAGSGKSIFLLGGRYKSNLGYDMNTDEDMAINTSKVLQDSYPTLNIIGATSQYSANERDDKNTLSYIYNCMNNKGVTSIDIIFVAYGHPKQEKWIIRNKDKIPAKLCIGVGGTFDYICGSKMRAPKWLQDANLEWLYKLVTQPWRIKRIIKAFPIFPYLVYKNTIKNT